MQATLDGYNLFIDGKIASILDRQFKATWIDEEHPFLKVEQMPWITTDILFDALNSALDGLVDACFSDRPLPSLDDILRQIRGDWDPVIPENLHMGILCMAIVATAFGDILNDPKVSKLLPIFRTALARLRDLREIILPPGRRRAQLIYQFIQTDALFFRDTKDSLEAHGYRWLNAIVPLYENPHMRRFAAQWERDYAGLLSSMSAAQLEDDWQRLGGLMQTEVLPLYRITLVMLWQYVVKWIHPLFFNRFYKDLSAPEKTPKIQRELIISLGMFAIFLEWEARHGNPRSLGSAVRGLPLTIQPDVEYIRACLESIEPNEALTWQGQAILWLIQSITDTQVEEILHLSRRAA